MGTPGGGVEPEFRALASKNARLVVPELRAYLATHRAQLAKMLGAPGQSGLVLARRHSKMMDGLLSALYAAGFATMQRDGAWVPVELAAVGGYGRELLGLKSDLDVRLLTTEEPERVQAIAEGILYPLWDAGVSIGHQVMNIRDALEAARTDLPTATALLDWRFLAGAEELSLELEQGARAGVFSEAELPEFFRRLEVEVEVRHRRFGDSVYLLEPDVKSGAGGLRDLDIARWAARARYGTADLEVLVELGLLLRRETTELKEASDFLWTLRNLLHQLAGRRSDRLTFDAQESIARTLGYRERIKPEPGASEHQLSGAMVESFMSDYYRHARVITRARESIMARAKPQTASTQAPEVDLGNGLRLYGALVGLSDEDQLEREPVLALRAYATAVARGTHVVPGVRSLIARLATEPEFAAALRQSPEAAQHFVGLVATAKSTSFHHDSILGELHDVGLLVAMIPEFLPVVGRVHHDIYHVYTVDVHSIAAVDRLRALVRGDLAQEQPLACRLAAEMTRPEMVFLATLLHDVGKAIGGRDHSRRGAEMAEVILARLGLSQEDIDEASHLILHHLAMYLVAVRRDIEDVATIEEFARQVHGREGLRDLYLLTVADLSTTAPTSMTPWKARMLDELFFASDSWFADRSAYAPLLRSRVREQVQKHWDSDDNREFLDEFLNTMPERYLRSNAPAAIAAHARVALRAHGGPVSVALVPSRHPDVAELCVVSGGQVNGAGLCVVAGDRPGLLAAIAAALVASKLEVHAAEVHSRTLPDGSVQAVDLFWAWDRRDGAEGVSNALPKLERDLQKVVSGEVTPLDLVARRNSSRWSERPLPSVSTEVVIDDRASPGHTVIEVLTKDRAGLLFTLAQVLYELGLTITVAKINTEGSRVADVFYVTETDGRKLDPGARTQEVRERLFNALRPAAS